MASASVALLAACALALFAIAKGFPPTNIIQESTNEESSIQSSSYNQQSYTAVDNLFGPDYVVSENNSGSSYQQNYEYDSDYSNLQTDPSGLYPSSLIQEEQQQEYYQQQLQQQQQQQINAFVGGI